METTGEHISASVMFQRTHARLWLLSSSWTVKSLVSSWYVSGKARALDWISLVVCRGEKECAQLGYLLTDSTDIVTFWSGFKTEEQSAEGDFFFVGLFNHANLIFILFFYDERLCHLPSCPVTLNHLITVDKAVFGGEATASCLLCICMHAEMAAVLSEALQACFSVDLGRPVHVYW